MPGKKEQVLFCRLTDRQRAMYEAFLQSDQVKQVLRGSAQMLGAITMLRKICNHPDLVCPPDQSSLDAFLQKGSFTEADLAQDYSDDEASLSEGGEESITERSGKLEVLGKILPLWRKQGHRYVAHRIVVIRAATLLRTSNISPQQKQSAGFLSSANGN